jgi:hypothetical protein
MAHALDALRVSPPFFQEKYDKAHSRRRSKTGNLSDPVLPVLSG